MKFIIICPFGVRTGGPEALFQLSDALLTNGFDAELWLMTAEEISYMLNIREKNEQLFTEDIVVANRSNTIDEYSHYQHKVFSHYKKGEDVTIILPEVFTWVMPSLLNVKTLIWWLSVDNAFGSLSKHNLNYLRLPNVAHATQSVYAENFVASLGLKSSPLGDYTVVRENHYSSEGRQKKISINAGAKVILNVDVLIEMIQSVCPDIEVVKVAGLSRDQVYHAFCTSCLFVDLGNFPGKDRMVREAILLGAQIVVANSGAGFNSVDYPIADTYRKSFHDLHGIVDLVKDMVENPSHHSQSFEAAKECFMNESKVFNRQVVDLFERLK
jgi:hypothetical protein